MENTQRITSVSRKLRLACIWLIVSLPVLCAVFWVFFNRIYAMAPMIPLPVRVDHDIPAVSRMLAFLCDMVPLSALIFALLKLKNLFYLYERGCIFTESNVDCYRALGRTLMVWVACDIVNRTLLGIVLTLDNPPGKRLLVIGLDGGDFTGIFVGIAVLIVSWVMDEARKMQEEQALII
ncbi:MAG TPA: DUF2975 domain-containing protein [Geobacteraceae bacterium]|nr:DUF2975 domain-containing protein [Geobacteraceae bacterium]